MQPPKTLWDFLQLLIVPAMLAVIAILLLKGQFVSGLTALMVSPELMCKTGAIAPEPKTRGETGRSTLTLRR